MKRIVIPVVIALCFVFVSQSRAQEEHQYVGVKTCKMCHKGEKKGMIFEKWAQSKHAQATAVLKEKGEEDNELCLKCHSTGYGAGGYDPASEDSTKFVGVQCEACHGPGKDYKKLSVMKDKEAAIAAGLVIPTEETCTQCHNTSYHKDLIFKFDEFYQKIEHKIPKATEE